MQYQDILRFIGLNFDDNALVFQPGDYKDALNIRIANTTSANNGAAEKVMGTSLVTNSNLPSGTNTCIGAFEDKKGKSCFFFVWNSAGNHSIFRYFLGTNAINLVFSDPILNFDVDHLITGIDLVDNLLFWTDNLNRPRKINVDKADETNKYRSFEIYFPPVNLGLSVIYTIKVFDPSHTLIDSYPYSDPGTAKTIQDLIRNLLLGFSPTANFNLTSKGDYILLDMLNIGGYTAEIATTSPNDGIVVANNFYPKPYIEDFINVAKAPPLISPNVVASTDTTRKGANLITKRVFEFRARYIYDDNEKSVWGPISAIDLRPFYIDAVNYIYLTISDNVVSDTIALSGLKKIEYAVREHDTGQWKSIIVLNIPSFFFAQQFNFYNDALYSGIAESETNKPYDSVPLTAKSQKIVDNRLFYGGIKEGYDPVVIDASVSVDYVIDYPTTSIVSGFKRGGDYKFGIVYYDKYLVDGGVNYSSTLNTHVLFYTEKNAAGVQVTDKIPKISWDINHKPPSWATHYQWVRSKDLQVNQRTYFQFIVSDYIDAQGFSDLVTDTPGDCTMIFFELNKGYDVDNVKSVISYTYEIGDRVRFSKKYDGSLLDDYYDFEIQAYSASPAYVPPRLTGTFGARYEGIVIKTSDFNLIKTQITHGTLSHSFTNPITGNPETDTYTRIDGTRFEIYNPIKVSPTDLFYEFGESFRVLTNGFGDKYHDGPIPQDIVANTPASGAFQEGDVYYRQRAATINYYSFNGTQQTPNGKSASFQTYTYTFNVDDPRIYDLIDSNDEGIGRLNIVNTNSKQIFRPTDIRFSNVYVQDTQINGLNSFDALNEKQLNNDYGLIHKLVLVRDSELVAICENSKTVSMPIGKALFKDVNGQQVVAISDDIIPATTGLTGSWGTQHAESVYVSDNDDIYFYDNNKGAVVRYASNGLFPISQYKAKKHFRDISSQITSVSSSTGLKNKVYGIFDRKYNEYILSFATLETFYPGETIAFSETENRWTTKYSFKPEHFGIISNQLTSFVWGGLHVHDSTSTYNNFYGVQYYSLIRTSSHLLNTEKKVKTWKALGMTSNEDWYCSQATTPSNASWPVGMSTNMPSAQFRLKEGKFYCEFNRDANTPNEPVPLYNGREMRGQSMDIELKNETINSGYIFDAEVNAEFSEKS